MDERDPGGDDPEDGGGFDHAALCYSVGRDGQIEELTAAGYRFEAVFDLAGQEASASSTDQWLFYVARKAVNAS